MSQTFQCKEIEMVYSEVCFAEEQKMISSRYEADFNILSKENIRLQENLLL